MKKFIVNLLSNRLGIILAALNLCFFVSKGNAITNLPFGKLFVCAHFPAAAASLLAVELVKVFAHNLSFASQMNIANVFFAFFIVAQSLLIAELAKRIARRIRPTEL